MEGDGSFWGAVILKQFIKLIIIFFIILIIISISYFVLFNNSSEKYTTYSYHVSIINNDNNSVLIIELPILIPLFEEDKINNFENLFFDNIAVIDGSLNTLRINDSYRGKTLFINSISNLKIQSSFEAKYLQNKKYIFSNRENITKFNNYRGNYWFYYSNSDDVNVKIEISYSWGEKDEYYSEGRIEGLLKPKGWQLLRGYEEHTISD